MGLSPVIPSSTEARKKTVKKIFPPEKEGKGNSIITIAFLNSLMPGLIILMWLVFTKFYVCCLENYLIGRFDLSLY